MSNCPRNLRDGIVILQDGTPSTPKQLIIPVMDGNLSFTEHRPKAMVMNRGKLYSKRSGNEMEVDLSFEVTFTQWGFANASTGISVPDALNQRGGASDWVSADPSACNVYAVNVLFQIADPEDGTKAELLTFNKVSHESIKFQEGDPNKLTFTGKAFITTVVRTYGTKTYSFP